MADNRRVGSLTRKVQLRSSQKGNQVAVEITLYDKLLEILTQVGAAGDSLAYPLLPFIAQLGDTFPKKMAQLLKGNPEKYGKTRQEIRIYSSYL